MDGLVRQIRAAMPYMAMGLGLLLPGGSILVLLAWLYGRKREGSAK